MVLLMWGSLLEVPGPQWPHLRNGDNNSLCPGTRELDRMSPSASVPALPPLPAVSLNPWRPGYLRGQVFSLWGPTPNPGTANLLPGGQIWPVDVFYLTDVVKIKNKNTQLSGFITYHEAVTHRREHAQHITT